MLKNVRASGAVQFFQTFFSRGVIVKVSVAFALIIIICAVFTPLITSYDPDAIKLEDTLLKASSQHLLGCDQYGRDVFTRVLYGARVSLLSGMLSSLLAASIGMLLGLAAGYFEGAIGTVIMRYVDIQLSIPPLLFTIIIGLIVGHGLIGLIIAICFGFIPGYIRMMYGVVLSIKRNDYIVALRVANIKKVKIIFKHLLPNSLPSMIIMFAMNLGSAIMLESTLSFLGIGIQQPTASWGNMVTDGYSYLFTVPLLAFIPGICITLTVIAFNIIGDSLRDAIDPRLRGKL